MGDGLRLRQLENRLIAEDFEGRAVGLLRQPFAPGMDVTNDRE
jgi:hypothetical protein